MYKKTALAAIAAVLAYSPVAIANEYEPAIRNFLEAGVSGWIADPVLIEAIREQNAKTSAYDEAMIVSLDKQWRGEVGGSDTPLISEVLGRPASEFLQARRDGAEGLITEIFVMDAKGLNVAASDVTSDYWQGDEAKWQQTFPAGDGAVHLGDVELDESTQEYQSQVSIAITDPDSGETIGAATIGVNVGYLE